MSTLGRAALIGEAVVILGRALQSSMSVVSVEATAGPCLSDAVRNKRIQGVERRQLLESCPFRLLWCIGTKDGIDAGGLADHGRLSPAHSLRRHSCARV